MRVSNHITRRLENHTSEVCSLKWNDSGSKLASGGNDNLVNLWDINSINPLFSFADHEAAIRAMSWCPWQNDLLATGGGSADRKIRFWKCSTGNLLNTLYTEAQVTGIVWSKHTKEFVSTHGYTTNALCVWKYPSLVQQACLLGHTDR